MEAEYMSLSDATKEVFARIRLFQDQHITINTRIIYSDNQGTLAIAQNPVNYQRSKRIDIRCHLVRMFPYTIDPTFSLDFKEL